VGHQAVELAGQVGGGLAVAADDHLEAVGLPGVGGLVAEPDDEGVPAGLLLGVGGGGRGGQGGEQHGDAEHERGPEQPGWQPGCQGRLEWLSTHLCLLFADMTDSVHNERERYH
jgi:hypothetical protein